MFYIYTIFNIINGKYYIGKTNNLKKRWAHHKKSSSNIILKKAINKYGLENFEFKVLQSFQDEILVFEAEKYWISYFKSNNSLFGYNLTIGGEGASGYVRSEYTKLKQGNTFKERGHKGCWFGKKLPQELKDKLSKINLGKKMTSEARQLMSESKSGEKNPSSILNQEKVYVIKQYLISGKSRKEISVLFNTSYQTIADIDRGRTWENKDK